MKIRKRIYAIIKEKNTDPRIELYAGDGVMSNYVEDIVTFDHKEDAEDEIATFDADEGETYRVIKGITEFDI